MQNLCLICCTMGCVSPFVIQLKILFQLLCEDKLEWDMELSEELLKKWKTIMSELSKPL